MNKIFLDTNILISHDKRQNKKYKFLLKLSLQDKVKLFSCLIIEYEYLVGFPNSKKRLEKAKEKLSFFEYLPLDSEIIFEATRIDRHHQIGMADSIIATLCLRYGLQLATLNKKHFKGVRGLEFWG